MSTESIATVSGGVVSSWNLASKLTNAAFSLARSDLSPGHPVTPADDRPCWFLAVDKLPFDVAGAGTVGQTCQCGLDGLCDRVGEHATNPHQTGNCGKKDDYRFSAGFGSVP